MFSFHSAKLLILSLIASAFARGEAPPRAKPLEIPHLFAQERAKGVLAPPLEEGEGLEDSLRNSQPADFLNESYYTVDNADPFGTQMSKKLRFHLDRQNAEPSDGKTVFAFFQLDLLDHYGVPTNATGWGEIVVEKNRLTLKITYKKLIDPLGRPVVDQVEIGTLMGNRISFDRGFDIQARKPRPSANSLMLRGNDQPSWIPVVTYSGPKRDRLTVLSQTDRAIDELREKIALLKNSNVAVIPKNLTDEERKTLERAMYSENWSLETRAIRLIADFEPHSVAVPEKLVQKLLSNLRAELSKNARTTFGTEIIEMQTRVSGNGELLEIPKSKVYDLPVSLHDLKIKTDLLTSDLVRQVVMRQSPKGMGLLLPEDNIELRLLLNGIADCLRLETFYFPEAQRERDVPSDILRSAFTLLHEYPEIRKHLAKEAKGNPAGVEKVRQAVLQASPDFRKEFTEYLEGITKGP